ncbi:uncharacterized protein LOC131843512 [Achroia grisella]|uniref:uncharacterized protein LOC131843512 n=1 Tax=Achroia grisella TaxID=688607 RepID=UPI0027D30A0D|nr:uncharacterized protein LOC131843512 [Achroia grisella]
MAKYISFTLILLTSLCFVSTWKIFPLDNPDPIKTPEAAKSPSSYTTWKATSTTVLPVLKTNLGSTESVTSKFSFKLLESVSPDKSRISASENSISVPVSTGNRLGTVTKPSRDLQPPKEDTSETQGKGI